MFSLRTLQHERQVWAEYNFGEQSGYQMLASVVEEAGELAHYHLKGDQRIRGCENSALNLEHLKDCVGDVVVFLAGYCTAMGIDMQDAVESTWKRVKQRDWRRDPLHGGVGPRMLLVRHQQLELRSMLERVP